MAVSIATVESDAIAELNAALTYTTVVTSPRFYTPQIASAALSADALVCEAIMRNKRHPRRTLYYASQAVAHGALLSTPSGDIADVQFVVTGGTRPGTRFGTEWDPEEIEHEIRNVNSDTEIEPHYAFVNGVVYHNGAAIQLINGGSVTVNVRVPQFTRTSACQAPDEYQQAVLCGTLALLFPVEGENVDVARFYWTQFQTILGEIATGQTTVPTFRSINQLQGGG